MSDFAVALAELQAEDLPGAVEASAGFLGELIAEAADQLAAGYSPDVVHKAVTVALLTADTTTLAALAGRAVLKLTEARRPVAEYGEEWAIRVDEPHPLRREAAGDLMTHFDPEKARRCREIWHGWTPMRRAVGPWEPADETGRRELTPEDEALCAEEAAAKRGDDR